MKRFAVLGYGVFCYLTFLLTFAYLFGFLGNTIVPKTIDSAATTPAATAVVANLLLLAVFGLQHTVMARPTFKRWWTRFVPKPIERSTYVLLTNVALVALFVWWQPMAGTVWDVSGGFAGWLLQGVFLAGWLVVFVSTVLLNHFDLFGLRQVWLYFQGKEYTHLPFKLPLFYKRVRHPLYVGWLMTFWATPSMSAGHMLFTVAMSSYILIAIVFEERNLIEIHGEKYAEYRRRVPMLVPLRLGTRSRAA